MNSSGILKRGLAATAISALAVAGVPALAGTAHAAPGTLTVAPTFSAYDLDEFNDATKDLLVTVKETDGTTPTVGQDVEYSFVFTLEGGVAAPATPFAPGGTTGADGTVDLEFDPPAAGTYTVTVRTVGSHISAPAFTFVAGQGEIIWADGASASSPQNGSDTYAGSLTLGNAAATPLSGRTVAINYDSAGDVIMSTPQPAGTARVDDDNATATTGANGGFSVGLTDSALPVATDSGTLIADTTFTPASNLAVSFEPTPVVKAVTVTTDNVFGGSAAPGKPVELNVKVTSEGATPDPGDDVVLKDAPVTVTVDKGFLTPDTEGEGMNVDPTDLVLTDEQNDENDLFGFYESLTNTATVNTSDDAGDNNAAGIVATIEEHEDFLDDGMATQTVTVTAGGRSAETTITYDSSNYLNLPAAAFVRDGGVATAPGAVDLKLFAADQYGNLVGGEAATVTDNTPVARVDAEAGGVRTDFVNDNPSVTASSDRAVQQVITANIPSHETLVNATGDPAAQAPSTTTASHTLNWRGGKEAIVATLRGNGGGKDTLRVSTTPRAKRAIATLFKVVNGTKQQIGQKALNNRGKATFTKRDLNGKRVTKYVVKVAPTNNTKGDRSNTAKVK